MLNRFYLTLCIILLASAALATTPERIQTSNLNESQISISWVTTVSELGKINYGLTTGLGTTIIDDLTDDVHHISPTNLAPDTKYYYDIISGVTTDNNSEQHYTFTTVKTLANPPVDSDLVYGQIFKADGKTPAKGAVVYMRLQDNDKSGSPGESALVSCRTDDNGYWFTNLVNFRTTNNTIFTYSPNGDNLFLQVEGGSDGSISREIDTANDSPALPITLTLIGDTQPPYTMYHYPAKNEVNVQASSMIMLHVLDDISGVDKSSIVMKIKGIAVTPIITGSNKDYTLVYNPSGGFKYGEQVNVSVQAKDLSQPPNTISDDYSFVILIDKASPYIVDRYPKKDAVDIRTDTNIIIYLKDDLSGIDKGSITVLINNKIVSPEIIGISSYFILSYTPPEKFGYSQKVNIEIRAKDLAVPPNSMTTETYSFTTVKDPDIIAPYTDGHSPTKNASNVSLNTSIVFHIKDSQSGVDSSSIKLQVNGVIATPTITGNTTDFTVSYKPSANFGYSQVISIIINARDISGNAMPTDSYSFTTEKTLDDTIPPYTNGHQPAKGAINVATNTTILIHIKDDGVGVNKDSIELLVNGTTVSPVISGTKTDYIVSYKPSTNFNYEQQVNIIVKAKDLSGNVMPTESYGFKIAAQSITSVPSLSWTGEAGYENDGITPDTCYLKGTVAYRIKYADPANILPKSGYPKLYIYLNGKEIKNTIMSVADIKDTNYKDGKIYWYSYTIPQLGSYSYRVEATNQKGTVAIGTPINFQYGPIVDANNNPPQLKYFYTDGGVSPKTGNIGSKFEFQVIYSDADNNLPGYSYPALFLTRNGTISNQINMEAVDPTDTNVIDGKVYRVIVPLNALGNYTYRFDAMDSKGMKATGEAITSKNGPTVQRLNTPPTLELGFDKNKGVNPSEGKRNTTFEWRVKYTDTENDPPLSGYPKIYIYKAGKQYLLLTMYPTDPKDNNYTDGKLYSIKRSLVMAANYSYKFIATDIMGTTTASGQIQGPLVSASAPSDGVEILDEENIGYPFPNPVTGYGPVSFFGIPDESNLKLYNIAGELVFEGVYYNDGGWTPSSSLSSGIYIYLIECEGRIVRGRLGIVK
ncbi:MAG: T9SS type A sorting domain-containing protein [Candidatus Desantisbacteria bacterium]